jgi:hypothetical protein
VQSKNVAACEKQKENGCGNRLGWKRGQPPQKLLQIRSNLLGALGTICLFECGQLKRTNPTKCSVLLKYISAFEVWLFREDEQQAAELLQLKSKVLPTIAFYKFHIKTTMQNETTTIIKSKLCFTLLLKSPTREITLSILI